MRRPFTLEYWIDDGWFVGLLKEVRGVFSQGGTQGGAGISARNGGGIMKKRIAVNSEIHFGKPCVAGTRIPVQNVLELVREGLSFAEIIRDYYPDLEPEDIRACIQYAIDVVAAEDIHLAPTP